MDTLIQVNHKTTGGSARIDPVNTLRLHISHLSPTTLLAVEQLLPDADRNGKNLIDDAVLKSVRLCDGDRYCKHDDFER